MKVIDVSKLTTRERTKLFADFSKELSVMKTLAGCPRVVRMFGYCEMVEEQQLALLMQLAHGGTVANLLEDKSVVLTDLQKGIIIHQSAMGMEYLIERGVLHRDLKSFNLLMDKDGSIMVSMYALLPNHCTTFPVERFQSVRFSFTHTPRPQKVSDFGISKATSTQTNTAQTANPNANSAAGTTPWMAPEGECSPRE